MLAVTAAAQAARCLTSCRSVAVALRCDLPSAMLACTVYAAAGAASADGGPGAGARAGAAGALAAAGQCLGAFLRLGQRECQERHGTAAGDCAAASSRDGGGGGAAGELNGAAGADEADEADEADALPEDAYLRPPPARARRCAPLVTYVALPALPRGAAVEFQPVALADSAGPGATPGPERAARQARPGTPLLAGARASRPREVATHGARSMRV